MTATILFGSFTIFLLLTVPIGIALGMATFVTLYYTGALPIEFLSKELVTSVDSFPLMAVPFFILAGELMGKGGISDRLFKAANVLVGNRTGGFAIATIIACMFFAAISGSAPATVAAIGGIMIPMMINQGYDRKFATATVAAAGALGVLIPPSIPMVIFGVVSSASVGDMFIAGVFPGLLVGFGLIIWAYIYSRKQGYTGSGVNVTFKNAVAAFNDAKWALLIPVIILGGIYGGIFTPTEAAVVAVVYGLFAGLLIYRELKIKDIPGILQGAALTTATILIIVGTATAFGKLLTVQQIPVMVAEAILNISESPIVIMLLINLLLLLVGTFMDTLAAIIILTPILLPIAVQSGFDPIHFGIIMIVNLAIGFITPPLGVNLFVSSGISGLSIEVISRAIVPYFITMIITLLMITYIPQISLYLVNFMK